jgi:hypothetical protein
VNSRDSGVNSRDSGVNCRDQGLGNPSRGFLSNQKKLDFLFGGSQKKIKTEILWSLKTLNKRNPGAFLTLLGYQIVH